MKEEVDSNTFLKWDHVYTLEVTIRLSEDHSIIIPVDYNPSAYYKQEDWEKMSPVSRAERLEAAGNFIIDNEIISSQWYL
jgi:hypothetical protein